MSRTHQNGYPAPAVKKAFDLLMLVAESGQDLGVSELSRLSGFSKSTTHGLIQTLLTVGALEQQKERKKYCLGPAIVELAFGSWNHIHIQETAQPYLDALRDETDETVFLGSLGRRRAIIIATSESKKALKISALPGTTLPIMAGAVGKLFLSRFDEEEARRIIRNQGLRKFTPASIGSEAVYLDQLNEVREKGYALDKEEYLPGVRAVAVGIDNLRGMPLAIWVVGFIGMAGSDDLFDIIQKTLQTANRLRNVLETDTVIQET